MLGCGGYGGVVDGVLVQGLESSYAAINFDKETANGGCWALSVMWMAFRATSSGAFADYLAWIKRPSGVRMMNGTQVEMSRRKSAGESSKVYLKQWLAAQHFIIDDATAHNEVDWPATAGDVGMLTAPEAYKFINLQFRNAGHAVACQATSTGVTFFDPNHGQATFGSHDRFRQWMVDRLLPDYHRSFGLTWFRVTSVGRGIGPSKPIG